LGQLVADAELPPGLADQLSLLAEGAMADFGIFAAPSSSWTARAAGATLMQAASANDHV
jgi:hypothetical protein